MRRLRCGTISLGSSWTDYGYDNVSRPTALTQRFAGITVTVH